MTPIYSAVYYTSKFFLTGNVGLILRSTAVVTTSRSTVECIMRVLCSYCMPAVASQPFVASHRVPSTVLRLTVATAVLRNMRPT